ncbi:MAG: membrane protein insertase YidC [Bacteroidales bacterium]|jgi:YidC/Oxa1 family membrane protein insertase
MDRNTITGLILIFLVFIGFSIYNNNRLNKGFENAIAAAEEQVANGNLERARTEYVNALRFKPNQPEVLQKLNELNVKLGITPASQDQDPLQSVPAETDASAGTRQVVTDPDRLGVFSAALEGEEDFITLENNLLELKISLKGGRVYSARLKEFVTHDSKPLILFSGDSTVFGFNFFTADNKAIQTNDLYFSPLSEERSISVADDPGIVVLRLNADSNKYIEYKYTLLPDRYNLLFDVSFHNMDEVLPANQNSITLDWRMYIPQKEKGRTNEENYTSLKYKHYQDDVEGSKMRTKKESETFEISTRLSWVAYVDQFFSAVIITDTYFLNGSLTSNLTPESKKYIRYFTSELGVPVTPGPDVSYQMRFYFGPNHLSTLKKEGHELEKIIYLGKNITGWISRFIIIPVFNWLEKYIDSYGIIILILTILIKLVLFPLTFKSYQSQAKMRVLKPLVDELNKKYPKQEDAMKKQQATMDLYKRAGINPMGGCLPMLLQFPILFAMFRFFPVSIELRQEHFLWATDLSTYDSILDLPFTIPIYGSHVSLFTLLMTASSILTMKMSGSSAGQDQPGMKMMTYMMPVMFMLILNQWSSGLTYYYFLANILTWIQNMISKRFIDEDKVLAALEENKKKPVKKSKWQQRLEEAARQRGINPPKR